jgi:hypothetical protein
LKTALPNGWLSQGACIELAKLGCQLANERVKAITSVFQSHKFALEPFRFMGSASDAT